MYCSVRGLGIVMHCSVRGLGTVYALLCKRIGNFSRIAPFPGVQVLWHRFPLLQQFRDVTHTRCAWSVGLCSEFDLFQRSTRAEKCTWISSRLYIFPTGSVLFDVVSFMTLKYIYCFVNLGNNATVDRVINLAFDVANEHCTETNYFPLYLMKLGPLLYTSLKSYRSLNKDLKIWQSLKIVERIINQTDFHEGIESTFKMEAGFSETSISRY
jgi:hypothetical protein